jgi:hypothetical protein
MSSELSSCIVPFHEEMKILLGKSIFVERKFNKPFDKFNLLLKKCISSLNKNSLLLEKGIMC